MLAQITQMYMYRVRTDAQIIQMSVLYLCVLAQIELDIPCRLRTSAQMIQMYCQSSPQQAQIICKYRLSVPSIYNSATYVKASYILLTDVFYRCSTCTCSIAYPEQYVPMWCQDQYQQQQQHVPVAAKAASLASGLCVFSVPRGEFLSKQ